MWKRLSVFCVILALALAPLAAWPTWLTGEPEGELQLKQALEQKEEVIQSQKVYIEQLETQLESSVQDLMKLAESSESLEAEVKLWQTKHQDLQILLAQAQSDTEQLSTLSTLSSVDSSEKVEEIASLEADIVTVQEENVELYAERQKAWGGLVGGGATWDPTSGRFGATVDMGVRYKDWALVVGAEYKPSDWKAIPSFSDFSFSSGIQFSF